MKPINLETDHNTLLMWFQTTFPDIVRSMKECNHNFAEETAINGYHTEGSIFCHTMMVFKNSQILFPGNHYIKWTALFHDIGKPLAAERVEERQRVRFISHESLSAFMVIDILNKTEMSEDEKLHIFKIIALHGTLFNFIKADGTIKSDIRDTFEGNSTVLEDLVKQVTCDSSGRFINSEQVTDNNFEFTLNLPKHFEETVNALGDDVYRGNKPHQLTLLVGAPCSDKSTFLREDLLKENPNTVVISRDALIESVGAKYGMATYSDSWKFITMKENKKIEQEEVDAEMMRQVQTARREKRDLVVDMTLMSRKSRRKWINQFEKDYNKKCILFIKGFEQQLKCNEERGKREGKRIHSGVTLNMIKSFSLPMFGEGFDEIEYKLIKERF